MEGYPLGVWLEAQVPLRLGIVVLSRLSCSRKNFLKCSRHLRHQCVRGNGGRLSGLLFKPRKLIDSAV